MNSLVAFNALFFCSLIVDTSSLFSHAFQRFLFSKYGGRDGANLVRYDLPYGDGSFGGGKDGNVSADPVILVHGATDYAGMYADVRDYFLNNSYADNEVYATTYADAGKTQTAFLTLKCEYVKVIRQLIIAVHEYTGRNVSVIAYSLGSPIARKAILGSTCVDTEEDLGPPLTDIVITFVGVAGANYGSSLCVLHMGVCSNVIGISCNSRFLNDINSKVGYEGKNIYTIYSKEDDVVGYKACDKVATFIQGQKAAVLSNGSHINVLFHTTKIQYDLIQHGYQI